MSAPAGLDLTSTAERIQSEVQRLRASRGRATLIKTNPTC
jgi:hypothetical protein